jgi:hypothetical protein
MRRPQLLGFLLPITLACGTGSFTGNGDAGTDGAAAPIADSSTGAVDSGPSGTPGTVPVAGLYFGACLSTLAASRIDRVLRFYTEVAYTPPTSAAQGTIELKLTALKVGPNQGPPLRVSKAETVGQTYTVAKGPLSASGVYAGALGTLTVPGAANPISGRDIVVEQAAVPGRFAPARFCSQLSGHVVQPTDLQLEGDANTCLYFPVKEGDPVPAIQNGDFAAGCPLN